LDPSSIFRILYQINGKDNNVSYKGQLHENLNENIESSLRILKGESKEDIKKNADWMKSPVYKSIKELLDIEENATLNNEVILFKSDNKSGIEIKFYDYKRSEAGVNHHDFVINIHIKFKDGFDSLKSIEDIFKLDVEKSNEFIEAKNLNYEDKEVYKNFSISFTTKNLGEIENIHQSVRKMQKIIRYNTDLCKTECRNLNNCKDGYFCRFSHKSVTPTIPQNWKCSE
jgi:hypothetical protein